MSNTATQPLAPNDLKDRVKVSYDAIAETYSKFTKAHDNTRLHYGTKLLGHWVSKHGMQPTALELGCGAGGPATELLIEHGFHVTGNDISAIQLELAKANLVKHDKYFTAIQGDMMELDFPIASFDVVFGLFSIIHLPRQEQRVLVKRVFNWLRPCGVFLANFSKDAVEVEIIEKWLGEEQGWMFWSGWGEDGSVNMVEEAGLEVLMKEVRDEGVQEHFVWVLGKKNDGSGSEAAL
ncbi:methyltransferase domain-containing protein [Lojkania enalia]|uniref:Methyltransferase domain-containing protein n=1 Tax=Lojkania enalia TaxID=147567 RepID=A0A9P4MYN8_9PLEO|nr:methyltransferase domain-containing protein [Didymosphaeria enalia]